MKRLLQSAFLVLFGLGVNSTSSAQCTYSSPYSENFTTFAPTCWTEAKGSLTASTTTTGTTSDWVADGFLNVGTAGSARMNIWSTTKKEWLISPKIDLGTVATSYQLEFDAGLTDFIGSGADLMGPDDTLAVVISLDSGDTWSTANILKLYTAGNQPSNIGENIVIDLSAYTGKVKIGFYAASTVTNADYNVYIDNFSIDTLATCPKPSALATSNITINSIDFNWTENGTATSWQVEYGVNGFTLGSGTKTLASTTSLYSASSLSSATEYSFYVRAICGAGDTSKWSGPISAFTLCAAYNAPFYTNFENDIDGAAPLCWNTFSTISNGFARVDNLTGTGSPFAGTFALYMYSGSGFTAGSDTLIAISPEFADMNIGNKRVRFQMNSSDLTSGLVVGTMSSTSPTATFTPLDTFTVTTTNTYNELTVDLTTANGYNGTDKYVVFAHTLGSTFDYIRIDNFNYEVIPTCIKPSSLTINTITATSVDFGWTEAGSATSWQVQSDTTGFSIGTGTKIVTGSNPYTVTGLNPATQYEFYVRAICTVGDTSYWQGPISALTACVAINAPYYTGFENDAELSTPLCWNAYSSKSNAYVRVDNFTGTGSPFLGTNALYMYSGSATAALSDTLIAISPEFGDMTAGDKRVRFQMNSSDLTSGLIVGTVSLATPTATFNPLDTFMVSATNTYSELTVDLTTANGYNGTDKYVVFAHTLGSTFDYVRIDEFRYEAIPNCIKPTGLSKAATTSTSFDLFWTEVGTATSWQIQYDTTAFAIGTGTKSVVSSDSVTISGLTANTSYDAYVRSICAVGDTSGWEGPISIYTGYCLVSTTSTFDYLSSVTTTGAVTNATYSATAQPAGSYADESAQLITSFASGTFDINTTYVGGTNGVNVWVDWNNDFDFDDTLELIGSVNSSSLTKTFNIAVPATAVAGNYRMRVRAQWGSTANPPSCGSVNYGSTVDFTLVLSSAPSCLGVTTLASTAITSSSADIFWTENNSATTWQVEYDTTGFTLGTGTKSIVTSDSVTISSLAGSTTYDVYVRAICGAADSSLWTGPISFTTLCVPVSAPFIETFQTATVPSCWIESGDNSWEFGSTVTTPVGFAAYGAANVPDHSGTSGTFIGMDGSDNAANDVSSLETPLVDISALNKAELTYWVFSNNINDTVINKLIVEVYSGTQWIQVDSIQENLDTTWVERKTNLTALNITGIIKARFTVTGSSTPGFTFYNDILLDDIKIDEQLIVYQPIGAINTEDSLGVADLLGNSYWTSGTVAGVDLDGNNGISFTIIDQSGTNPEGINIFNFNDVSAYVVNEGDSIMVRGEVQQFNGLTQLFVDSIAIISTGSALPANALVTVLDESTESALIRMENMTVTNVPSGTSINVTLSDGTNTFTMRVDNDTKILDSLTFNVGDVLCSVNGIGGQFDNSNPFTSGYQIFPMRYTDVVFAPSVDLGIDTMVCDTNNFMLDAGAWTSYVWSTGATTRMITPNDSITQYIVTVMDANGCTGTDTINVTVTICTSINDNNLNSANINFYPNPSKGQFRMEISGVQSAQSNLEILNVNGQVVYNNNLLINGSLIKDIDINVEPGIYFVKLSNSNGVKVKKLIVE